MGLKSLNYLDEKIIKIVNLFLKFQLYFPSAYWIRKQSNFGKQVKNRLFVYFHTESKRSLRIVRLQ